MWSISSAGMGLPWLRTESDAFLASIAQAHLDDAFRFLRVFAGVVYQRADEFFELARIALHEDARFGRILDRHAAFECHRFELQHLFCDERAEIDARALERFRSDSAWASESMSPTSSCMRSASSWVPSTHCSCSSTVFSGCRARIDAFARMTVNGVLNSCGCIGDELTLRIPGLFDGAQRPSSEKDVDDKQGGKDSQACKGDSESDAASMCRIRRRRRMRSTCPRHRCVSSPQGRFLKRPSSRRAIVRARRARHRSHPGRLRRRMNRAIRRKARQTGQR